MDARHQLVSLRGWIPLLIGAAVFAGGLAFVVSGILPRTYEAKSTLIIGQSLSAVNPDYSQLLASQQLSNTYVELATTRPLLLAVIANLQLDATPEDLGRRIQAAAVPDSSLLTITGSDANPSVAAAISNALSEELIKASPDLQGREAEIRAFVDEDLRATQSQIESTQADVARLEAIPERTAAEDAQLNRLQDRLTTLRSSYAELLRFASNDASNLVTIVEPAVAPADAVSPRPLINTMLAGILGLLLVLAVALIIAYLDNTLKTPDQVQEALNLPTLGSVPRTSTQHGRSDMYQTVMLLFPNSVSSEAYRTLRTNLEFTSVDAPVQTLLVTSPGPGEGKTVTAANLAVAFAQAGRTVLLVDADLRKPGVHSMFNVENTRGLSNLLRTDDLRWESVVQFTEQANLRLLTTGPQPPNPAELLGTQRMRTILDRLREAHDLIIVDSPPLLVVTDPTLLSSFLDGTLLVLDAKRTGRDGARQGQAALAKAGARVLGVLINGQQAEGSSDYGGYYRTSKPD